MRPGIWSKGILLVSALALRLPAQTQTAKLDCNRVLMVDAGLTSTCELRESTFDAIGSLTLANPASGGVSVYSWDSAQVLVRSRILAAAGSDFAAAAVASQVDVAVSPGQVKVTGPKNNVGQNWSATLEIYVPAASTLRISVVNGGIAVQNVAGDITAATVNGAVEITGASGNINATSVNGSVSVSAAAPWKGQTISAKTVNGSVNLAVPADCSGHVNLSTVHGSLSTTVPGVTFTVIGHRGAVSFELGSGASPISGTTVNGNVTLRPAD